MTPRQSMRTHLDLFSGIGGFSLAARWAGFTTVAFCEIDSYAQQVIVERFGAVMADATSTRRPIPKNTGTDSSDAGNDGGGSQKPERSGKTLAHNDSALLPQSPDEICPGRNSPYVGRHPILWPDIRKLDGTNYRGIYLLTGGFPCQPFSCAGKRRGAADDRALWPEMFRVIAESEPTWCLAENVPGIIGMELDRVLSDLEGIGYETGTLVIPACAVDAPHRRDRVWIVAHAECSKRRPHHERTGCDKERDDGQREAASDVRECGKVLADTGKRAGGAGFCENPTIKHGVVLGNESSSLSNTGRELLQGRIGEPEARATQRQSQSNLGRAFDGLSGWLDRNRQLTMKSHKPLLTYGQTTNQSPAEVLRVLRGGIEAEILRVEAGGQRGVSPKKVLFAYLCQLEKETALLEHIPLEGQEASGKQMRGVRHIKKSSSASHRSRSQKQRSVEHSNSLHSLSSVLALHAEQAWGAYRFQDAEIVLNPWKDGWEDGFRRLATGVKNRVNRLKGLGNAIVPQLAYQILKHL